MSSLCPDPIAPIPPGPEFRILLLNSLEGDSFHLRKTQTPIAAATTTAPITTPIVMAALLLLLLLPADTASDGFALPSEVVVATPLPPEPPECCPLLLPLPLPLPLLVTGATVFVFDGTTDCEVGWAVEDASVVAVTTGEVVGETVVVTDTDEVSVVVVVVAVGGSVVVTDADSLVVVVVGDGDAGGDGDADSVVVVVVADETSVVVADETSVVVAVVDGSVVASAGSVVVTESEV
ncbi:hypothetical protein EDD21DRAFT_386611 [Dissophora ornata]|nr:hypothetical protein EDD21DRAFT_386611 [Dissophora ornata]